MVVNALIRYFESLYASVFFAATMTTAFYGITCMQSFYYYVHYQDDPLRTKLFVATLWGLDTIHEGLVISGAYKFLLAGLTSPLGLLNGIPEFVIQLLTTALAAIPAQGYFVYRIYVVNEEKSVIVPLTWATLGCYQLVCTIIYISKALYLKHGVHVVDISVLDNKFFTTLATSALSVAAAVDILIAISMTYLLFRKRTASTFMSTTHILQRLIVFSVNTGSWTAFFALWALILMHAYPTKLAYAVFAIPLCSIYCNTVLANLNARQYIRGGTTCHGSVGTEQVLGSSRESEFIVIAGRHREKMKSVSSAPVTQVNQNTDSSCQSGTSESAV